MNTLAPPTEQEHADGVRISDRILATVELDGDGPDAPPLTVASLLRADGAFWIERLLGKRASHGTLPAAMTELESIALAYNARVRCR
jgi:hypothetical protein